MSTSAYSTITTAGLSPLSGSATSNVHTSISLNRLCIDCDKDDSEIRRHAAVTRRVRSASVAIVVLSNSPKITSIKFYRLAHVNRVFFSIQFSTACRVWNERYAIYNDDAYQQAV